MATEITKKSIRPYVGSNSVIRKRGEWIEIVNYLKSCIDVKQNICFGCGSGAIYDKNNARYWVTWKNTVDEVKATVEQIRKINSN